jgi:hypothetical protein
LVYATSSSSGPRKYLSVLNDTSLRERLQKVGLDVDGSREYLLELWKNYVRANFV